MDLSGAHPNHTNNTATTASIVLRRLVYESINQIYLIHAQSRQYKLGIGYMAEHIYSLAGISVDNKK